MQINEHTEKGAGDFAFHGLPDAKHIALTNSAVEPATEEVKAATPPITSRETGDVSTTQEPATQAVGINDPNPQDSSASTATNDEQVANNPIPIVCLFPLYFPNV